MEKEQLNILLAGGNYTDIMVYSWLSYSGGLNKLLKDGVIQDITSHMGEWMPNLSKYYADHPDVDRQVKDDSSRYLCIPFLKQGRALLSTQGPNYRQDLLKETGLEPPQTLDEWEAVFVKIKELHPDIAPLTGTYNDICRFCQPAYGVSDTSWFVDNTKTVRFASLEDGFKQFITRMADWYSRGLIDSNFATYDVTTVNNVMSSGMGFATYGSSMDKYNAANVDNGDYLVVAERTPGLKPEERVTYVAQYEFGSNPFAVISTKCTEVEVAMRMYDWAFSPEGYRTLNWGIEGESFTIHDDGLEYYTDLILHNPDGLSTAQALAWYVMAGIKGPAMLAQDERYMIQYYSQPIQVEALQRWGDKDYEFRGFPPVSLTDDETSEFVALMADIDTYVESMCVKFILGQEPLSNWDNYVQTLKNMNIQRAIDIQQAAVNRYYAR